MTGQNMTFKGTVNIASPTQVGDPMNNAYDLLFRIISTGYYQAAATALLNLLRIPYRDV